MTENENEAENVVPFRSQPTEPAAARIKSTPPQTDLGRLLETVELLNQRVHILHRACAALIGFATEEQRFAVDRLVSQAEATYTPAVAHWPEGAGFVPPKIADTIEIYADLFRS